MKESNAENISIPMETLREIDNMISKLTHTLSTPLTSISNTLQMIQGGYIDGFTPTEECSQTITTLLETTYSLSQMLSNLRLCYYIPTRSHVQTIDISQLLKSICIKYKKDLPDYDFSITFNTGNRQIPFTCYVGELEQVFSILFYNIIYRIKNNKKILLDISLTENNDTVNILFKDRSMEYLKIRDREMLEKQLYLNNNYFILALPIAREIISQYGGEFQADTDITQKEIRYSFSLKTLSDKGVTNE